MARFDTKFGVGAEHGLPQPLSIVIFGPPMRGPL